MPTNIFIQRLSVTVGALLVYRVGRAIPVPGLDAGLLHRMSGRSIETFSIFALGVTPIFSALLLFELLKLVFPPLARWEATEQTHARRLYNIVYIVAVAMAAFQAYGVARAISGLSKTTEGPASMIAIAATMMAGAMLLGWLGDRITRQGLGTGFWLILIVPVLVALPSKVAIALEHLRQGAVSPDTLLGIAAFLLVALIATVIMALYDRKRRTVTAAAEKQQYRISGADFTLVWPPLFAVMIGNFVVSVLSWPESVIAQHGLIAVLILVLTGLQTLGVRRSDGAGERVQPWIIAAIQIFVCIGSDMVTQAMKTNLPLEISGVWFIIVVVTMINLLRDSPPLRGST